MSTMYHRPRAQARAASGLNALIALWLVISPWTIGFSDIRSATWNCLIVGLVIAFFALIRAANPSQRPALSWLNFLLGIWLVLSPFLLQYGEVRDAMWNTVTVGLTVLVLSAWSGAATQNAAQIRQRGRIEQ